MDERFWWFNLKMLWCVCKFKDVNPCCVILCKVVMWTEGRSVWMTYLYLNKSLCNWLTETILKWVSYTYNLEDETIFENYKMSNLSFASGGISGLWLVGGSSCISFDGLRGAAVQSRGRGGLIGLLRCAVICVQLQKQNCRWIYSFSVKAIELKAQTFYNVRNAYCVVKNVKLPDPNGFFTT
jgi:hypothetical protein